MAPERIAVIPRLGRQGSRQPKVVSQFPRQAFHLEQPWLAKKVARLYPQGLDIHGDQSVTDVGPVLAAIIVGFREIRHRPLGAQPAKEVRIRSDPQTLVTSSHPLPVAPSEEKARIPPPIV